MLCCFKNICKSLDRLKLVNTDWLEVMESRRTEVRFLPDLGVTILRKDGSGLEIHVGFACD